MKLQDKGATKFLILFSLIQFEWNFCHLDNQKTPDESNIFCPLSSPPWMLLGPICSLIEVSSADSSQINGCLTGPSLCSFPGVPSHMMLSLSPSGPERKFSHLSLLPQHHSPIITAALFQKVPVPSVPFLLFIPISLIQVTFNSLQHPLCPFSPLSLYSRSSLRPSFWTPLLTMPLPCCQPCRLPINLRTASPSPR